MAAQASVGSKMCAKLLCMPNQLSSDYFQLLTLVLFQVNTKDTPISVLCTVDQQLQSGPSFAPAS